MSDTFQGDAIACTILPGAKRDVDAMEFLALASADGPLEVGGRYDSTLLPFDVRQIIGDGTGPLGKMQVHNPGVSPVVCLILTSSRAIRWSDPSTGAVVAIVGAVTVNWTQDNTVGGEARSTLHALAADGAKVRLVQGLDGRLIVGGSQVRDLTNDACVDVVLGTETIIVPAIAAHKQDLTGVIVANSDSADHKVRLRDAAGGVVRLVVKVKAGETVVATLPRGVIQQRAINTDWTAQLDAAVSANPVSITACTEQVL